MVQFKKVIFKLHLWLGLAAGLVIFLVCLTGAIYTFRAQIENGLNYKNIAVNEEGTPLSLDSIRAEFKKNNLTINQIVVHPKLNRSIEVFYTSIDGSESGMYYVNPFTGAIIGNRNSALSPFFEFVLSLHKSLLLNNIGKRIVGASVLIFVFMLLSGLALWFPKKLRSLKRKLRFKRSEGKARLTLDLHQVNGFYSFLVLLLIAIMGLYITYPWMKSTLIVVFGGNPVLSQASDKQSEKIKMELAASFAESLKKIIDQNNEKQVDGNYSLDTILLRANEALPYKSITRIQLPTAENSWVSVRKSNRKNLLRAILIDELDFNQKAELKNKNLFKDKSLDQKFVALSLPLHTGEILGWPSLVLYFLVSLIGASLPVTGTLMWYRRMKTQTRFNRAGIISESLEKDYSHISTQKWLIAYASKSGNSKLIALALQQQFKKTGLNVKCSNISQVGLNEIRDLSHLFVTISTDGQGVEPPSARKLFKELRDSKNGTLDQLQYSICALGDSAYDEFCKAGKDLESLLLKNKSKTLVERVDCDTDFSKESRNWIIECINKSLCLKDIPLDEYGTGDINLNSKQIQLLKVKEIFQLTKGKTQKPCFHITLESDHDISYIKPGDSIEIHPNNPKWLVNDILDRLHIRKSKLLFKNLSEDKELTRLSKNTLQRYYNISHDEKLNQLLNSSSKLIKYLTKANFYDLLMDFPYFLSSKQLLAILPPKKGRLYSVASSTAVYPRQIHLTVKSIRYQFKSRKHEGVGSIELTENLQIGEILKYKHYPNFDFRLPESPDVPLLMIGIGTGIAPFRAFIQECMWNNYNNKIWLIWGDKNRESDYLYKDELEELKKNNSQIRIDLAFSRDGESKTYVQDIIRQNQKDFISYLINGAHVYVCGSIKMANDLREVVKNSLYMSSNLKISYEKLNKTKYHEDTY
ncbi:PepSY domain-containing protein [Marinifilum caeruleilacunae]|uniref:Sulfite reductase (NADPH) flavoprotein alpha-component n=1 Tax=Marinifilum caeruleilacunae TaxID=2499076 RepID=A0ABX1WXB3_9BACT|nr:PepSY domain-containing protein [Marinifilum caeruleilacunae]NOU60712.1 hypothetical protein [Marinifilum caeruleilacunae]